MRIGPLRHRVQLQTNTPTRDSYGDEVDSWGVTSTVYAQIDPVRGREFFAAGEKHSEINTKITMRYQSGVVPTMRVVHGSDTYDIRAVIDVWGRQRMLELMCRKLL